MSIYFDNSATTVVCPEAAQKALYMMTECYGNPSSLHSMGFEAEKEMNSARKIIADKLFADEREIYFTSGGTESDNLAVFGAVKSRRKRGKRIVTTSIEHPAVLNCMKELEAEGFEVVYLRPDTKGNIDKSKLFDAVNKDTILVSMMSVNNETGAVMPILSVAGAIKRAGAPALFHVDNVQGFGKLSINPAKLGIDLMSISGHKVHAPKGVGALYVSRKTHIHPVLFGGGQEKNLRPGTEALPNICAFGAAVQALPGITEESAKISEIRDKLISELLKIDGVRINSPENALPYIVNFSAGRVRAETLLHFLEAKGIFVSTGSACSKAKPSHVLSEMGLAPEVIDSSLRVSFSRFNNTSEVEEFIKELKSALSELAHY